MVTHPSAPDVTVTVAVPAEDVLHLLVHVREVPGAKGQEGVSLRHTRLPVEATIQVEVNISTSVKYKLFMTCFLPLKDLIKIRSV